MGREKTEGNPLWETGAQRAEIKNDVLLGTHSPQGRGSQSAYGLKIWFQKSTYSDE